MSAEIVTTADGALWVIDGEPGNYRARPVGEPIATDPKKFRMRRRILDGEFEGEGR